MILKLRLILLNKCLGSYASCFQLEADRCPAGYQDFLLYRRTVISLDVYNASAWRPANRRAFHDCF